jgi:hypothetical protein
MQDGWIADYAPAEIPFQSGMSMLFARAVDQQSRWVTRE